ncbi:MAG TPA: flippase-like domain-containing protein [Spirochaetes bacterium]|nr:flippase-like domain-containing protein [Spirochaetota bacterium]
MKYSKLILTILGISLLGYLIVSAGLQEIFGSLEKIGFNIVFVLILYLAVIYFDTLGWKYVIISKNKSYNFWILLRIKLAGDCVSNVTPAGSLAGEPIKVHILTRYGVTFLEGMASAYMAKLLMIKGQILFVFLGLFLILTTQLNHEQEILFKVVLIFVLVLSGILGVVYYLGLNKGITNVLLKLLEKLRLNFSFIENQREKLALFDEQITYFYKNHKRDFFYSFFSFFLAWFAGSIEIYLILYFLDFPITFVQAIAIESIGTVAKGLTFFIPFNLLQELTFIGLFKLILNTEATDIAISCSLIRRFRELLWVSIGFFILRQFDLKLPKIFKKNKVPKDSKSNADPLNDSTPSDLANEN